MPRRRRTGTSVSLFPFLSVLACVIGTLTLMISALALGQMGGDVLASAEQFERVQRKLAEVLEEIGRLKKQMADARTDVDNQYEELLRLQEKLERLDEDKREARAKLGAPIDLEIPEVDEKAHRERLEAIREQIEEVREQIEELRDELQQRKKPPDPAVVRVRPSGSGVGLKPVFVECADTSVVIHEGEKPQRIPRGALASDDRYLDLLKRVAGQDDTTIVFLLRDDGIATYKHASRIATSHYAKNGKIPVIGHGKLDLSLFK